jgi:hypothetical protein
MISNENNLNYKVADIDEIFNFHIKVISIRIQIKKIHFFLKTNRLLPRYETAAETAPIAVATAVRNGGSGIILQNIKKDVYFCKFVKNKYIKKIKLCA